MKYINTRNVPLLFIIACPFFLASCGEEKTMPWDGEWQRTVTVPKGIQGRCIDETLIVHGKDWHLKVVMHSTFKCDQPFLELGYEGVIQEVKIKRNTGDKDIRFQVSDIHLADMADVTGTSRTPLSKSTINGLSDKYVPEKYQFFEQKAFLSEDGASMASVIFQPVLDLSMPTYPEGTEPPGYQRVK